MVFVNGEQLTGELESADGGGIKFKSPMAGELSVPWKNIKSLDSAKPFAVISKSVKLTRRDAIATVPEGTVAATDKTITVASPAGPKELAVSDTSLVIPDPDFVKAVNQKLSLLKGWAGAATGGVGFVRATQDSTTFTGNITLVRAIPTVSWLPPRNSTMITYNQAYGTTTQVGIPTIETNIFHAGAERDEYFSPRMYAFADVAFDHNFSQALALSSSYGGGIGYTVLKSAKQQLDVKADIHYAKQNFFPPTPSLNLIGSTFTETYLRHLPKSIMFTEFGSVSPAWNNSNAYAAHINGSLVFPVYKGLGFNVTAVDDYLNNAPVDTKKNSTQFTTGITYTIKPRY